MIIYQFSNTGQIVFIVVFSLLAILCIVGGIILLPLLRLSCSFVVSQNARHEKCESIKAVIFAIVLTAILYTIIITLLITSLINILGYSKLLRNTNIDTCELMEGTIQQIEISVNEYRGRTVDYYVAFSIGNQQFYINNASGVTEEKINELYAGAEITVYYRNVNGVNEIVRIEK